MNKTFLSLGAMFGAIAVALGAFGAHGLRNIASGEVIDTFKTGVQYQVYHTIALLVVAVVYDRLQNKWIEWSGWFFSVGIGLFCGSLYLITALKISEKAVPVVVGIITPVGGFVFIVGWLCLFFGSFKKN